jgi:hypothetical protein
LSESPQVPVEWWQDAPDDNFWGRTYKISIYDPRHIFHKSGPLSLLTPRVDTVTNARIKRYLSKDVLQVANDDIFPTGDFEATNGKKKRAYDVSRPGEAEDKERSLEESKRRAKSKVQDISLCNRFTHMFTWTLNGELIDRYDSEEVYKKVRAFLSNMTQRKAFRYVCIPEYHERKEGEEVPAIHMHGLCVLGDVQIAPSIRSNGTQRKTTKGQLIYNMLDWSWGFSTVVPLDENYERAVGYVTKYITKAPAKIFGKWYLSSRSLKKSPDVIPLERMSYEECKDETKLENGEQKEVNVYLDVKILTEEFSHADVLCGSG